MTIFLIGQPKGIVLNRRTEADITQTELAEKIGWQQTDVSKVERRLDVVEFLAFAKALKIDVAEFVRRLQG